MSFVEVTSKRRGGGGVPKEPSSQTYHEKCGIILKDKIADLKTCMAYIPEKVEQNSYEYLKPFLVSFTHADKLRRHAPGRNIHVRNKSDQLPSNVSKVRHAVTFGKRSVDEDLGKGVNSLMDILRAIQDTVRVREKDKFLEYSQKNIEKDLKRFVDDHLHSVNDESASVNIVGNNAISICNKMKDARNVRYLNKQRLPVEPIFIDNNGIVSCPGKFRNYNSIFNNRITCPDALGISEFNYNQPIFTIAPVISFFTKGRRQLPTTKFKVTNLNNKKKSKHELSATRITPLKRDRIQIDENGYIYNNYTPLGNINNEALRVKNGSLVELTSENDNNNNTKNTGLKNEHINSKPIHKTRLLTNFVDELKKLDKLDRFFKNNSDGNKVSVIPGNANYTYINNTLNTPATEVIYENELLYKTILINESVTVNSINEIGTQNIAVNVTSSDSGGVHENQSLNRTVVLNEVISNSNDILNKLNSTEQTNDYLNDEYLTTTNSKCIMNNHLLHSFLQKNNSLYMLRNSKESFQTSSYQTTVIVLNKMARFERTFNIMDLGKNIDHNELKSNLLRNITVNITMANQVKINGSINLNFDTDVNTKVDSNSKCTPVPLVSTTVSVKSTDMETLKQRNVSISTIVSESSQMPQITGYQTTCFNISHAMLVHQNEYLNVTTPIVQNVLNLYNDLIITNTDKIKQSDMPSFNITNVVRYGTIRTGLLKQNFHKHKVISASKNRKKKVKLSTTHLTGNNYEV